MKKYISILILCVLMFQDIAFANVGQPSLTFDLNNLPPQEEKSKKDSGLSGGAVTAITLGSIGGLALLGLGGLIYKRKAESGLMAGRVFGHPDILTPVCLDEDPNAEFYARINRDYPYLKKALSVNEIHYCPNSKYILVYDTDIDEKTFDVIKFDIPENTKKINITLATENFKEKNFGLEAYALDNENNLSAVEFLKNGNYNNSQGIISGSLGEIQNTKGELIINNYNNFKHYAVVIEFVLN